MKKYIYTTPLVAVFTIGSSTFVCISNDSTQLSNIFNISGSGNPDDMR